MSTDGIPCPGCGCVATDVTDSRPQCGRIRRRRQCKGKGCRRRFTTYESMDVGEFDRVTLEDLPIRDRVAIRHLVARLKEERRG